MSMYADYLRERTNDHILENEWGFATYRFMDDDHTVYIVDIFISQKVRGKGHAASLADRIADEARFKGCTKMLGTVLVGKEWTTTNAKILLAYGFEIQSATAEVIIFRKSL